MQAGFRGTKPPTYKSAYALDRQRPLLGAPKENTVKFGSVKGAKTAQITFEKPAPNDAKSIEELQAMINTIRMPNRSYGVPINWTFKRVEKLLNDGQVKERIQKSYDDPDQNFWSIAKNEQDEIVGFVDVFKKEDQKAFLYGFYIHPDYQCSSVSSTLFQQASQWAFEHGCKSMEWRVEPYSSTIEFYMRQGSELIPGSFSFLDQTMPLFTMSIDLPKPSLPGKSLDQYLSTGEKEVKNRIKNENITLQTPKLQDAEKIEELHALLQMLGTPNRIYCVPLDWTKKITKNFMTTGVRQVKKTIQEANEHPDQHFWSVAKNNDGEIIGFVEAFRINEQKACLNGLYVHSDYQGTATAKNLINNALDWSQKNDYKTMELMVTPYNTAIGFYRNQGFELVPDSLLLIDQIMPVVAMNIRLEGGISQNEKSELNQPLTQKENRFIQKLKQYFMKSNPTNQK